MEAPTTSQTYALGQRGRHLADPRRETNDFYPTPPGATRALLGVEHFDGGIWEPACGDGAMSRVLEAAGHQVLSTDLIDRGYGLGGRDFLCEWQPLAPHIVTNPPFRWAPLFVERALQLTTGKVALFLRLAFLEGQARARLFRATPLARVHVFANRITFTQAHHKASASGMLAFAWFVWEHGHQGPPTLGWVESDNAEGLHA